MKHLLFAALLAVFTALLLTQKLPGHYRSDAADSLTVYVVSHGWHTGLVLKRSTLPESMQRALSYFRDKEYLEVGWGERDFYRQPDFNLKITARAILWPTQSVVHVVGFNQSVTEYFPYSTIIRFNPSLRDMRQLVMFLESTFTAGQDSQYVDLGPGLYGYSRFYDSPQSYVFPATCNVWTARAMKQMGVPLHPFAYQTAERLMQVLMQAGQWVQAPRN